MEIKYVNIERNSKILIVLIQQTFIEDSVSLLILIAKHEK